MLASHNQLSPELQFVFACVRLDDQAHDLVRSLLHGPLNWDVVYAAGLHHAVLPLLYQRIHALNQGSLPQEAEKIRAAFVANAHRNLRLAKLAVQVSGLLEQQGIACLVIKGPATGVLAYGDLSLRYFVDLDILIHPQDFSLSHRALVGSAWQPVLSLTEKEQKWLLRGDKDLSYHQHGLSLELHWNIAEQGIAYPIRQKDLWQNLQGFQLLDRHLHTLSPENTLILLALHGAKHNWRPLKFIVDFAACLRSFPHVDWAALDQKSRQYGLRRCLGLGLLLAEQVAGISIPAAEAETLKNDPRIPRLAADIRNHLVSQDQQMGAGMVFYLQTRERTRDKAYYVLDQLLIPKQADWLALPLPGFLYPLYFLLRPLRLLYKFGFRPSQDSTA